MPYEWTKTESETRLDLWPYRSLPKRGFVIVIAILATLLWLPAMALLGSAALWGLLPFMAATIAVVWFALQRSYRDGEILEELRITPELTQLTRSERNGPLKSWDCNTYWAQVHMHESDGPVPHYVTLKGNGREVEIGAFLSEDERRKLFGELLQEFRKTG